MLTERQTIPKDFEQGFYELCQKHEIKAAFIHYAAKDAGNGQAFVEWFAGGHRPTCKLFGNMVMGVK